MTRYRRRTDTDRDPAPPRPSGQTADQRHCDEFWSGTGRAELRLADAAPQTGALLRAQSEHHEAMIWWATVHQMTRRPARELAGRPPFGRWSDPPPLPTLTSPDRRGKVLELLAAQPRRAWKGTEFAAILGIENINSFRVQLSQWSHQGHINKISPATQRLKPLPTGSEGAR